MNYYAVIDTNVLVSAMLNGSSVPGIIVSNALAGSIIPLLNIEILDEYRDVLVRDKFGFDKSLVDEMIAHIKRRGIFLTPTKTEEKFTDISDAIFYEIVMTAREETEAYLITGNSKHYPAKEFVLTPREMLDKLEQNSSKA